MMVSFTCLNPFEVREVLQVHKAAIEAVQSVSIPLKSGRCCKIIQHHLHYHR